jgi:hypothetical protein
MIQSIMTLTSTLDVPRLAGWIAANLGPNLGGGPG